MWLRTELDLAAVLTGQGVCGIVEGDCSRKGRHSEAGRQDPLVHRALSDVQKVPKVACGALMVFPVRCCEEG